MLKIPRKVSVFISIVLSVVFFIVCLACAVCMSGITDIMIQVEQSVGIIHEANENGRTVIMILAYSILALCVFADMLLFALLMRVRSENVFTALSVSLIRGISWCCFGISGLFCILGLYFNLTFIVAFAAVFLGICLRVVKNVIEEATAIKSENDFTV